MNVFLAKQLASCGHAGLRIFISVASSVLLF